MAKTTNNMFPSAVLAEFAWLTEECVFLGKDRFSHSPLFTTTLLCHMTYSRRVPWPSGVVLFTLWLQFKRGVGL